MVPITNGENRIQDAWKEGGGGKPILNEFKITSYQNFGPASYQTFGPCHQAALILGFAIFKATTTYKGIL